MTTHTKSGCHIRKLLAHLAFALCSLIFMVREVDTPYFCYHFAHGRFTLSSYSKAHPLALFICSLLAGTSEASATTYLFYGPGFFVGEELTFLMHILSYRHDPLIYFRLEHQAVQPGSTWLSPVLAQGGSLFYPTPFFFYNKI